MGGWGGGGGGRGGGGGCCSECLSFPHCQYTASPDLDTFPEIFRSAIIGNYDCEKGELFQCTQEAERSLARLNMTLKHNGIK